MTHWLRNREKQVRELQDYATALEKREAYLINRLQKLAEGYGSAGVFSSHTNAMQDYAGSALSVVAKMERPIRPALWWL